MGSAMARKRKAIAPEVTRLEARTRALSSANKVMIFALCVSAGFVVAAASMPQKRKLEVLQERLAEVRSRETAAIARRDDHADLFRSLKNDPACLEQYARDRLDYYRAGERILRIDRGK